MHPRSQNIVLATADESDMEAIYGLRHDIYAIELGQHRHNDGCRLIDSLDKFNHYVVAKVGDDIAGFISITPPSGGYYSVDKYFDREDIPLPFDDRLFEVRILTVPRRFRGSLTVAALMYGALRWIEASGGVNLVAIGREGLTGLYEKAGFVSQGKRVRSGAVTYELLTGDIASCRRRLEANQRIAERVENSVEWRLDIPMKKPKAAFHGGAFFDAIGADFDDLSNVGNVISADVLDAWFPPSPKAIDALANNLQWTMATSPPTGSEGLVSCIANVRGIDAESVLAGAGSSSLIYGALRHLLNADSKALILEPSYGEYAHILEHVIGCQVDRFYLHKKEGYDVNLARLRSQLSQGYDFVVLVNPNNPTGRHIARDSLIEIISNAFPSTLFWIDETYVDFINSKESLETFAAKSDHVIVCKSMSKAYALSGLRVGYLCGPKPIIEELSHLSPPWAVSLTGQLAAVNALQDPGYYAARYRETHRLRKELADGLRDSGISDVIPGVANYLLAHLPEDGPDASQLIERCKSQNLFLRHASTTAPSLSRKAFRVAVKDADTNQRMLQIIGDVLAELSCQR